MGKQEKGIVDIRKPAGAGGTINTADTQASKDKIMIYTFLQELLSMSSNIYFDTGLKYLENTSMSISSVICMCRPSATRNSNLFRSSKNLNPNQSSL